MNQTSRNFNEDIRAMKIIHIAMLAGQLIFGVTVLYLVYTGMLENAAPDADNIFKYLIPAIALGAYLISNILFKKLIQVARANADLGEKLAGYRGALITSYAFLEGCSLLAIIATMLTSNMLYLGIAGVLMLYFLTIGPKRERIVRDLELSPSDEMKLMEKD
jgi:beta-lactamase regulating signal transducer with metallopeptidase domain